jgi:hypothetical protein
MDWPPRYQGRHAGIVACWGCGLRQEAGGGQAVGPWEFVSAIAAQDACLKVYMRPARDFPERGHLRLSANGVSPSQQVSGF